MVSKRNIRLKKLKIQDSKFEFNQDKYKVIQKIHERKLNKFSKENAESNKRNRDASLEEMEDKLIKKRLSDLHFEEEKHAKLKKQLINKRKLINVLKDLKRPKELLHDENCNKFDSNIMWNSPSYIIRHIRNCILNHDWNQLTHLLLLLMNHQAKYFSYIKEISFLNFLVNQADCNSELLEEFIQKCFVSVPANYSPTQLDVCYMSSK